MMMKMKMKMFGERKGERDLRIENRRVIWCSVCEKVGDYYI